MDESIKLILDSTNNHMTKSIDHLKIELNKIRAGRATPAMIDGVSVDYYGNPTPLSQVANVAAVDARTITITPWEKKMIPAIERAIMESNLGFNPQSDGEMVRIHIPNLTEDRRKDLVKQAKHEGENSKIAIRSARHESLNKLKALQKEGVSEDEVKTAEKKVQDITNDYSKKIDDILQLKESEIMTV